MIDMFFFDRIDTILSILSEAEVCAHAQKQNAARCVPDSVAASFYPEG